MQSFLTKKDVTNYLNSLVEQDHLALHSAGYSTPHTYKLSHGEYSKPDYIAALWPPNAILLAALILSKPRYWWCFLLASVPAEMAADIPSGIPWKMALGFPFGVATLPTTAIC